MDLELFIRTALGDASGNPVTVGQSILDGAGNPVNLPQGLAGIGGQFGPVGTNFQDLFAYLGKNNFSGIGDVLKKALKEFYDGDNMLSKPLSDFFKGDNVLAKPFQRFMGSLIDTHDGLTFFAAFIEGAIKVVIQFAVRIVGAIKNPLAQVSQELFNALGDLIKAILDVLTNVLNDVQAHFPVALRSGPLDALTAVSSIAALFTDLKVLDGIRDRVDDVENSLTSLLKALAKPHNSSGSDDDTIPYLLLSTVIGQSTKVVKELLSAAPPADKLKEVIKDLVFPKDVIINLLRTAKDGKLWAWAELPSALPMGALNRWLNDPSTYRNGLKSPVERDFRVRMVAAADAYIRGVMNDPGRPGLQTLTLTRSDERNSGQALSDVICILFDTIMHFVLEPECFPLLDIDLYSIEDLGVRFGALFAREIRIAIRGLVGLVLRGFWEFSLHNEVLIEFIGVVISAFFSAMIEAVIRNLTWSLQVVSCYAGSLFDTPPPPDTNAPRKKIGDAQVAYYWPSAETVANTGEARDRIWYVALVRTPGVALPAADYPKPYHANSDDDAAEWRPILGLLRDFGAYIDVCYRRFRIESRFPQIDQTDEISVTRAELTQGKLVVWATTSAAAEVPQPVLRAYFCCSVVVMRPGTAPADPYTIEFGVEQAPRCVEVIVLSNRGGVGRRRAVRV